VAAAVIGTSTGVGTGIWYRSLSGRAAVAMLLPDPVETPKLTRREREVASLVAQGLTNREIASRLFISERTAESHVEQLRGKLGFHTRSQVAAWVAAQGLATNGGAALADAPTPSAVEAPSREAHPALTRRRGHFAALGVGLIAVLLTGLALANGWLATTTSRGPSIVTLAGTGLREFSPDGGPAASAALVRPLAVAAGPRGETYIAEGNRVREVEPDGRITTLAGTGAAGFGGDVGPATLAELNTPQGLAVDSAGRVYIADTLNNRVRRVDADGSIRTVAGTGEAGYTGDEKPAIEARMNLPTGVAIGFGDSVFIADTGNNVIRQIGVDGIIRTVAGTGEAGYTGEGGPALSASLHAPGGLAFDDEGNLYIADTLNQRIRRVNVNGQLVTVAGTGVAAYGGDGGQAIYAELNLATNPLEGMGQGLAVGPTGDVFIADALNHRLRKLGRSGVITTVARLKTPLGVAVDAHGFVYVADADDNRVLRID